MTKLSTVAPLHQHSLSERDIIAILEPLVGQAEFIAALHAVLEPSRCGYRVIACDSDNALRTVPYQAKVLAHWAETLIERSKRASIPLEQAPSVGEAISALRMAIAECKGAVERAENEDSGNA